MKKISMPNQYQHIHWPPVQNAEATQMIAQLRSLEQSQWLANEDIEKHQFQQLYFLLKHALARAYIKKPKILLLDEPANNLFTSAKASLSDTIDEFHGKATIIYVTQNMDLLKKADRLLYLHSGGVLFDGTPQEAWKRLQQQRRTKK